VKKTKTILKTECGFRSIPEIPKCCATCRFYQRYISGMDWCKRLPASTAFSIPKPCASVCDKWALK